MEKYQNQQLTFAGMVLDSSQKITKNGDPFGAFTIEDFSGSMNMVLFSETYLKKKHLLETGNNIYMTVRIEERRFQPGTFQLKVVDIMLLSEVMGKFAQAVSIFISAKDINNNLTNKITECAKNNIGDTPIQIRVTNPNNNVSVLLKSTKTKVEPRLFLRDIKKETSLQCSVV